MEPLALLRTGTLSDWAFAIAFTLVCTFAAFNGFLMLISPERQTRLWDWLVRADRWSRRNPNWNPGRGLERRLAGLGIAAMALWMDSLPIRWFLDPIPTKSPPNPPVHMQQSTWAGTAGILVVCGVVCGFGLYTVVRPAEMARWSRLKAASRLFSGSTRGELVFLRLIGAAMMILGGVSILSALRG